MVDEFIRTILGEKKMYGTIMHLDHTFHLIITYTYSPQHTNEVFCKLVKDKVDFITVWVGDEIVAEKRRSKVTYPDFGSALRK